jgi:3',5'-cyclic AMP phosphodiesterase CpdA
MFTLAHLSDPHLAPLPKPRWNELIGKRLTGYINWQRKRRYIHDSAVLEKIVDDMKRQGPDHIAVTGDIANIALPGEFLHGRDWMESLGSFKDVTFVPGNHDIYVAEGAVYAGRQWAAYMTEDNGSTGFPFLRKRGQVAMIGVSTAVPTAPFLATGWVGNVQLAALALTLSELKKENLFRVVMLHHPPVSMAPGHKLLLDAKVLLRVIAEHGAHLIIHGHDHLEMLAWLDGPDGSRVPAIGVPSASAKPGMAENPAGYHLYRIDGAPGAWSCEVVSRGMNAEGDVVEKKRFMLSPPSP